MPMKTHYTLKVPREFVQIVQSALMSHANTFHGSLARGSIKVTDETRAGWRARAEWLDAAAMKLFQQLKDDQDRALMEDAQNRARLEQDK